jgi:RHS repeat-associated protein
MLLWKYFRSRRTPKSIRRSRSLRRLPLTLEPLEMRVLLDNAAGKSENPALSADGQLVAFQSLAEDLVANDRNRLADVFVRDPRTGVSTLVSVNRAGTASANGRSFNPVLSADGRFVAFESEASDLVAGDTNRAQDVFVRDLLTGTTTLVSGNRSGTASGNEESFGPVLSADGRYVAFQSLASDLVSGDTNRLGDVFVRDLHTGTLTLVSVNRAGTASGNHRSRNPVLSADGRIVAFASLASDLAATDTNRHEDIFVRDLLTGTTTLVSASHSRGDSAGSSGVANPISSTPVVSADGRFVAFASTAADLVSGFVAGNGEAHNNIFVHDLLTGTTTLVSGNRAGTASGNNTSSSPVLSADGRFVAFLSRASNLVDGDTNPGDDVFVRDLLTGTTTLVSVPIAGLTQGHGDSSGPVLSADGRFLAFESWSRNLVPGLTGNTQNVFVYDLGARTLSLVSTALGGTGGGGARSTRPVLSADGRFVAFESDAGNLVTGDANHSRDVFVRDVSARTTVVASVQMVSGGNSNPLRPDVVVQAVVAPATARSGHPVTLTWTGSNSGVGPADGNWQDGVYLSTDRTLDGGDRLLALAPYAGRLAPGATYTRTVTVDLPAVPLGTYYLIVQADRRNQIAEGANETNNLTASAGPLTHTVPVLAAGVAVANQFAAPNQAHYFQISVPAGQTLLLALDDPSRAGAKELYVRRGALPTPQEFEAAGRPLAGAGQELAVPTTQAGTYYVLVHSRSAAGSYRLTASLADFGLRRLSPETGGNTGRVTLAVHGRGLTPGTQVSLVGVNNTAIPAAAMYFRDASLLYATFDLTGRPAGAYDVRLLDQGRTVTAARAFTVAAGVAGNVQVQLGTPEIVRPGGRGTVTVDYVNTGNIDAPAPLLQLTADTANLRLPGQLGAAGKSVHFLGISGDGPAGILRPGERGRATILLEMPSSTLAPAINFGLHTSAAGSEIIDWAALKSQLRPASVAADAWDALWSNFSATIGTTAEQLRAVLADNATHLGRVGEYTGDVARLLGFELQQANNSLAGATLAGGLDAAFPAPGLPLTFGRVFLQPLTGRYRVGPLGRGWTHSWEISLTTDPEGNFTISAGGATRVFSRQADGTYRGAPGDFATFSRLGGYSLRETDGTVVAFRGDGKLAYVEDTHGNRITAGYTGLQLTSLTHSNGDRLTLTYIPQGRLSQVSDPAGRVTVYAYDAGGQHLLSVSDPQGTTRYTYVTGQGATREHALAMITNPDGTHVFFEYDSRGRLVRRYLDGNAEAVAFAYDTAAGVTITDATGGTTQLLFNDFGQVGHVRDPLAREASFRYDANHQLVLYVSPTGLTYSQSYDDRGNVISQVDPLGQRIDMTYDPQFNRLTSIRDARGNTTRYANNERGDLRSITYPGGSQEQFQYDPLGNLTESVNRRGRAIRYSYDRRGLLIRKDYADGTRVDFTFDARGNLLSATDARGATRLEYDATDQLTKITYPGGRFLRFRYDAGGRRTQSVDQDGFTVNYVYDAAGRLAGLRDGTGATLVNYTYDAAGRLVRKTLGNGTFTTYAYDAAGQLRHLVNHAPNGSVNSRFDYTYDPEGRRSSVTTLEGTTGYGYDALGQLTSVALPGGRIIRYEYDPTGNRISVTDNGVTTRYTTNHLNQYTTVGTVSYAYDADGNLVRQSDGTNITSYSFDDENQLVGLNGPGGTWTYEYDPFGNRVAATHNGQRTEYLLDPAGLGNVVGEYTGAGSLIARYTHGLGLISRIDMVGAAAYYDFDALGSTVGMTGAAGQYLNRYSYLLFGETTTIVAGVANPFTFVGEFGVMGNGNGTLHMRFRSFDPNTGQFLSDDPIGLNGGDANLRRYVQNAPTNLIDPSGLAPSIWPSWVLTHPWGLGFTTDFEVREFLRVAKILGWSPESLRSWQMFRPDTYKMATKLILAVQDGLRAGRWTEEELIEEVRRLRGGGPRPPGGGFRPPGGPGGPKAPPGGLGGWLGRISIWLAVGDFLQRTYSILTDLNSPYRTIRLTSSYTDVVRPADPNDLLGPEGVGDGHWVRPEQTLPYTIRFENIASATAPAQTVVVTTTLDPDLDWTSFGFTELGFGATGVPLSGGQSFQTSVTTTNLDGSPLRVDITAHLDPATGVVSWVLRSIDPATGEVPAHPLHGFLPPNDATHRGDGFLRYSVRPRTGLASGVRLDSMASIIFDTNEAIATNTVFNTIDRGAPTSAVAPLPAVTASPSFLVSWSGVDDAGGSGIAFFDVYVSVNGRPFTPWLIHTSRTSAVYAGIPGSLYAFYSLATDALGHRQATAATAQAITVSSQANAEVAIWLRALASALSRADVVYGLAASREWEASRIHDDYWTYVGRDESAAEGNDGVDQFLKGATNEATETDFVVVPEFSHNGWKESGKKTRGLSWAYPDSLFRPTEPNDLRATGQHWVHNTRF